MNPKAGWWRHVLTGCAAGGLLLQAGCLTDEETAQALVTSAIVTVSQVITNTVFFALDSFLVTVS